jgi:hypothetical protein
MSSDPRLHSALMILRDAGHQIGEAYIPPPQDGNGMRIWIDGVPCMLEDVLKMAEEERKEFEKRG